jgi:hypothetical protein
LIAGLAGMATHAIGSEVEVEVEEAESPFVSGTLILSGNTHFVSYGQDIWGTGNDWGHNSPVFNPSIELNFDLGKGWSGILGTWWDVNNNADSSIGNAVQEVDVWAGVAYGVEKWSFRLLYQDWMYASQSERIVDFVVGYEHWLNPSLTLHARVDNDIGPDFENGLATVLGVAPGTDVGPVTLTFPLKVAFDTDGFHGGDAGFSFFSAGIDAGVPLTFIPEGDWRFNAGLVFYYTNDDVIPTNPDEAFITANLGVTLAF